MNEYNNPVRTEAETDVGLRSFMLGTYRYMAMAMAVTAGVAFFVGQAIIANPNILGLVYNPVVAIASFFIIVFGFGAVGRKLPSMSLGGVLRFPLWVCRLYGRVNVGLCRPVQPDDRREDILHDSGDVWRFEPVRLHHRI